MTGRFPLLLALLLLAGLETWPAYAEHPAECKVPENLITSDFALTRVARALAAKHLDILVVGAGSSTLPGPAGAKNAYPSRLQHVLAEKLPGVTIKVATDVQSRRTAAVMVASMPAAIAAAKPSLVVWQTETVDAMQAIDPDQFNAALDHGIKIIHLAGADVVLVNSQYSPRTESMIALGTYAEYMRWVAVQQEIPLFDRFSIMKFWSDQGVFDLYTATKKLDMAERVHDCIGRLLADFVIEAAKPAEPPPQKGGQN
jgi:hypothetical protein